MGESTIRIDVSFGDGVYKSTDAGKTWKNVDRHLAYELSPYAKTLVMDIDYFCFTDNLKQFLNTDYDFLVPDTCLLYTSPSPRDS